MPNTSTLADAAQDYLATLPDDQQPASRTEVQRFVRWCGAGRSWDQLHGQEVANYAETLTGGVTDAGGRADIVRKFLAFAKKAGHTPTNLGTHLRLRKASAKTASGTAVRPHEIELTSNRKAALEVELEALKKERPKIRDDLARAMADKDFRENAPLDAARERQGHVEGRIRTLEAMLANAVVVTDESTSAGIVGIGSTVHLRNLTSGAETIYTLVRPGEMNAAKGRISVESPVGEALLRHRVGDEVEVAAPSGTLRLRIERIEI